LLYPHREMTGEEEPAPTWHHGIVARWWAEFNVDGPEISYFQSFIEDDGQPALDLACGTGRLLVPYLRAGLDVDGCDISSDMLALCRERAEAEGLSPTLFAQPMHELQLPRRYRTIVVCGGFGLGGNRQQNLESLKRLYEHLEPGGLLLLDNEAPYADAGLWRHWPKEERQALPKPWRKLGDGDRRQGSDGAEYELRSRIVELDPLAQSVTLEMRADMWRDGEHVAAEEHVLRMSLYFTHELAAMLERSGFTDVSLRGDYTDEEPSPDTEFVVFRARKPS
jgi:SAM-dependent methyltransferase